MNGELNLITLIALVVAAVAIWKLKSVLGQRSSDDDARVERLKKRDQEVLHPATGSAGADVINMPRRNRDRDTGAPVVTDTLTGDAEARIKAFPAIDTAVTAGLLEIAQVDPKLDPEGFVSGAGRAYEMIVSAFATGDRRALKDLLSREVYDGFVAAIADREARGEKIEQQVVGISKSDILEAEVKSGAALITVRFISQLINATMDSAGTLVSGDPQKIKEVTDIWTFSRDVSSKRALENPNWRLVATQAPN